MDLLRELIDLKGRDRAAFKLGREGGAAGKPKLTQAAIEKSFGSSAWTAYCDGYEEGNKRRPKSPHLIPSGDRDDLDSEGKRT